VLIGVEVVATGVIVITAGVELVVVVCGGSKPGGGCNFGCSGASTSVSSAEMLKADKKFCSCTRLPFSVWKYGIGATTGGCVGGRVY
jgi:hypothetical protein